MFLYGKCNMDRSWKKLPLNELTIPMILSGLQYGSFLDLTVPIILFGLQYLSFLEKITV